MGSLASTLSSVVACCRTPERELFCICPSFPAPYATVSALFGRRGTSKFTMSSNSTTEATQSEGDHIGGLQIALIVIGVILLIVLIAVGTFFVIRAIRDRRRNHGEYRPQFEELHHAKDLPYLQPPAVEGLI
nr:crumbs homolog 3 [Haemonchus contortus]